MGYLLGMHTPRPSFGIAGNVAGHLEQAGEASDFTTVAAQVGMPKGMFPTHIPGHGSFLGTQPFDAHRIVLPEGPDAALVQAEPELALLLRVAWRDGQVAALQPEGVAAYNDVSIRKPADKISHKKNWGPCTKGLSKDVLAVDSLAPGGLLSRYRLVSFLRRDGVLHDYGEDSPLSGYSLFFTPLLDWIRDRLNEQRDHGPLEDLSAFLADQPDQILVGIGATRYTAFGADDRLQPGDEVTVLVYDGSVHTPEAARRSVETRQPLGPAHPQLTQRVEVP